MTDERYQSLTGTSANAQDLIKKRSSGRAMILCLDKSGSMAGTPFKALKNGASMVAKSIFELDEFEHFVTIMYDDKYKIISTKTFAEYEKELN